MTQAPEAGAGRVVLAAIAGAHGVRGEVRLKLFAQSLASLKRHRALQAGARTLTLTALRDGPHGPVARFAEIIDRDAAEALRGVEISIERAALPPPAEGEVYVADLIGLSAFAGGAQVGRVTGHENHGAGDLIEVETAGGRRWLVPFARCEPVEGGLAVDAAFLE